jgi:hypothetical protein
LAHSSLSVVSRAFEKSFVPCTPPHRGQPRMGGASMLHHHEAGPCSAFSSLRRIGATQDMKPALAVGHTQRFSSHKAYDITSCERSSSPPRPTQAHSCFTGSPSHMFTCGSPSKRVQTTPTYRDVLSNAANKPRHAAWGFTECKPHPHLQNITRMSLPTFPSDALKAPAFSVSSLVADSQAPLQTASNTHCHSAHQSHIPAPPSTAPAGRLRSSCIGLEGFHHATPDHFKPSPTHRTRVPVSRWSHGATATPDSRSLKRTTMELHTDSDAPSSPQKGFEAFSVHSPRTRGADGYSGAVRSPSTADSLTVGSPLNPKAQPFVPKASKLVDLSTLSHPILPIHISANSPQPNRRTPGVFSHPCVDSDILSPHSSASPQRHLQNPTFGAQLLSPILYVVNAEFYVEHFSVQFSCAVFCNSA